MGNVIENVGRALLIHGGVCNTFSDNIVINAGWGVQIRGKSRNKVINGTTYNVWNEINGAYNAYANTFLGYLVGIPESNGAIPGVAWKSTAWQTAFGNVLKYVNNKTDDKAGECVFANNYFVNVPSARAIYTYAGMGAGDITSSNNTKSATSLDSSTQAAYDDVVSNSGIYLNEYRKEN